MARHLNTHSLADPGPDVRAESSMQQPKLTAALFDPAPTPAKQRLRMIEAMYQWLIGAQLPVAVTTNDDFRRLFATACLKHGRPSECPPPSRATIRTELHNRYENTLTHLRKELTSVVGSINITTDGWTSISLIDYACVSAHFFDAKWTLQRRCLGLVQLNADHTAVNIRAMIESLLTSVGVTPFRATCDRGANFVRALEDMALKHCVCVCHGLDRAVRNALDESKRADEIRHAVKKIHALFVNSPQRLKILLDAQVGGGAAAAGAPPPPAQKLKMINDVPTRWNSILFMFRRAVALRHPIAVAVTALVDGAEADERIPPEAWRIIEDIITILTPLEVFSRHSEGERYVTASLVPIRYMELLRIVAAVVVRDDGARVFQRNLLKQLQDRAKLFATDDTVSGHTFLKAACMDPRVKDLWWLTNGASATAESKALAARVIASVKQEFNAFEVKHRPPPPPPMPPPPVHAPAPGAAPAPIFIEPPILPPLPNPERSEIEKWFDTNTTPRLQYHPWYESTPPEVWWKDNADNFPMLARFARQYLSIQASAAPVERIWKSAGRMVTKLRCKLSADTIMEQVFLFENRSLYPPS